MFAYALFFDSILLAAIVAAVGISQHFPNHHRRRPSRAMLLGAEGPRHEVLPVPSHSGNEVIPMKTLTIVATDIPMPARPPASLGERLAELQALINRAEELRDRPDPLARLEIELRQLERFLKV